MKFSLTSLIALLLAPLLAADHIPQVYAHAVVKPVALADARITGGYLGPYIDRTRDVSILDLHAKMAGRGIFKNFQLVADGTLAKPVGRSNQDEWVHKLVEAAGLFAPQSPKISAAFQPLITDLLAAQDKDGYLNAYYQNPLIMKKEGGDVRFRPKNRFEFYNFGHLALAGIAWRRTTGDDRLLQASLKFADLLCDKFGDKPLPYAYESNLKYEHPNHEMAMVELYRMTGNRRYLDFAAHTLDCYHFWSFPEVWGHCVQENLLLCGVADVYLEMGKPEMLRQLDAMWMDITERKAYLTGGVGDGSPFESYGPAYSLPKDKSYCETCAAISKVFFDQRMLLATGKSKYVNDLEQTFYNAVFSGVSLTGKEYFYVNLMESRPADKKNRRVPYFNTSCCASNLHRLLGSLQQYLFTFSADGVEAQLYGDAELKTRLSSGTTVHLRETSDYSRAGRIQFEILAGGKFTLSLRIPKWSEGSDARIAINGKSGPAAPAGEHLRLERTWQEGDTVTLEFDLQPRLITGRDLVADEKGRLALMRGPVVHCLESPDHPSVDIFALSIAPRSEFAAAASSALGGTACLTGSAWGPIRNQKTPVSAIPCHLWATRGASSMRIWIPTREPDSKMNT